MSKEPDMEAKELKVIVEEIASEAIRNYNLDRTDFRPDRYVERILSLSPSPDTVVVGREEIARIIDPDVWRDFEERRAYLAETYVTREMLDPLNLRNAERLNPSLAKADAILALSSLPVEGGE